MKTSRSFMEASRQSRRGRPLYHAPTGMASRKVPSEFLRPDSMSRAQRLAQPGARIGPVEVGGPWRDAQDFGSLRDRQAREVTELHQLGHGRVDPCELLQGLVEGDQVVVLLGGSRDAGRVEVDSLES